jgi:hypothetical protein
MPILNTAGNGSAVRAVSAVTAITAQSSAPNEREIGIS